MDPALLNIESSRCCGFEGIANKRVCVVIPAYNEELAIASTLRQVTDRGYTVILVDDCSMDNTAQVAESCSGVHVVRHIINLGQGASLQTAVTFARQLDVDFVVTFDADGQHDVDDIPALLAPLIALRADITLGSRFLREADTNAVPAARRIVLKLAIFVNFLFAGISLSDAHNGFRAMNRLAFTRLNLFENRMAHATEILYRIKENKLRYLEVPVHIKYTEYSKAKGQSALNSLNILIDLIVHKMFKF